MLSIRLYCEVPSSRVVSLHLPDNVEPGTHEFLVIIDQYQKAPPIKARRKPGSAKGRLIVREEDNAHLDDFKDYMQ